MQVAMGTKPWEQVSLSEKSVGNKNDGHWD